MAHDAAPRLRDAFARLHEADLFLMPKPWDVGSARILVALGFPALATTSSGHAETLGRLDHNVTRDELLRHVSLMAGAVEVPLTLSPKQVRQAVPSRTTTPRARASSPSARRRSGWKQQLRRPMPTSSC